LENFGVNCWNRQDEEITKFHSFEIFQKARQKGVTNNRNIADMLYSIFQKREGIEGLWKVLPF